MTDRKLFGPEVLPWENARDERLSPSSYGAVALFGIVEMAVEALLEQGYELTPTRVGQYSKMFARILVKAQVELGETGGWASALNTRLRGALRTAMRVVPFDETDQDTPAASLADWEAELQRLVVSIAKTAAWLHTKRAADL